MGLPRRSESLVGLADALQSRANDEFRLVINSRDRGLYTARADIVLDCRGYDKGSSGWGPGGTQSVGANSVQGFVHQWLPGDARFEARLLDGKQTLLFGQSEHAQLFAREWIELAESSPHDLKLIWIIPSVADEADTKILQLADALQKQSGLSQKFAFVFTLGIDRIQRTDEGVWRLNLLQPDDSTVEIAGDIFAPFTNFRPTPSLGPELLPQLPPLAHRSQSEQPFLPPLAHSSESEPPFLPPLAHSYGRGAGGEGLPNSPETNDSEIDSPNLFYPDYPGWRVATQEPHYYRLGSLTQPHRAAGLAEAYNQIRDLFALLGTRRDLDLYQHFDRQA